MAPAACGDWLSARPRYGLRVLPALLLVGLLLAGIALRCFEYDETYTQALLAGLFPPPWPANLFSAGEARAWFRAGTSDPWRIAAALVEHDTHPPLYFWLMLPWRALFGSDPLITRLPSALLTLGSAAVLWRLALVARVPPLPAVACALLAYAVLYLGMIARAYALSLLLLLVGTLLIAEVLRGGSKGRGSADLLRAGLAGLLFGLAILCHYLVALTVGMLLAGFGLTMLGWRRLAPPVAAGLGLTPPLLAAMQFHFNQNGADWYLKGFAWSRAPVEIAKGQAAALFGGTPLYFEGPAHAAVVALIAVALLVLAGLILLKLRLILTDPVRRMLLLAAVGSPVALLLLGYLTDHSPFVFRYFVFGVPFIALCFAAALGQLGGRAARAAAGYVLACQLAGAAAMPFAQATQQDYRVAVGAAVPYMHDGAVLLVPIGYDGVGMNGPFVWETPADWTLRVIRPEEPTEAVVAQLRSRPRLVLTTLADDTGRAAIQALRPKLQQAGWRSRTTAPFIEVWER